MSIDMTQAPVIEVKDLRSYLFTGMGTVKAVDGVSFAVRPGETLGIVGESGSGKTMMSLSLMRLLPRPVGRIVSGEIRLNGEDLVKKTDKEMYAVRGRQISMILQDPQTALNPVYTVGNQIIEALKVGNKGGGSFRERAANLLRRVNVAAPERRLDDYPHQLSGGMRQRVAGAIAMASSPQVIIADEPTTALDVTIQLQYLRLLRELQSQTGMAIIFITHDFGVVARMCDSVAVMYAGRIVEQGPVREIFNNPSHPYTQALLASVPRIEKRVDRLFSIEGQPPLLNKLPVGCRFAARCSFAKDRCRAEYPPAYTVEPGHTAACWRHDPTWPTL
ncbi:MAG TPA: ABC transporter ATP-binding protein [Devosiaceae bacterium]|jgi:oligopeptide/dipeptide ABC transporter ATP-binding protein